jgi:hypothetical protein
MSIHEVIGGKVSPLGGLLRCETCGRTRDLVNVSAKLRNGWPKHCGYTMRWWTQRQINAGEMPALPNV